MNAARAAEHEVQRVGTVPSGCFVLRCGVSTEALAMMYFCKKSGILGHSLTDVLVVRQIIRGGAEGKELPPRKTHVDVGAHTV